MAATWKDLLRTDRVLRVCMLGQLCSPKLVEMVGFHGNFDGVWFDQEHTGMTVPQIEEAARAARGVGLPNFVRLAPTDYATVMRALEAGSDGVMAAMIKTADEVENVLNCAK